ncbi:hypothetical protein AVEN_205904-1 [Araneus ventricosus]|uniref:Uncharacterized protein n=1 Tax=Araneus ventricosus TaxID=182803 RepID=A0A4Y2KZI7_ARAVE|nr:hypothetical protein AVEN_205904-1 [Araneus ventricosus]
MAVLERTSGENDLNENHQYQMRKCIRSNEAVWRILDFPIHERHPTVIHLSVHLGQRVYLMTENAVERAQTHEEATLTSFFRLYTRDEFACTLLYNEVPKCYTLNNENKCQRLKQGQAVPEEAEMRSSDAFG